MSAIPLTSPLAVLTPGHAGYPAACATFNLTLDQRPAAVVEPRSAREVEDAVAFAADRGLRVAVQGTTHGAATLASLEDALLVRTGRLRGIDVDPVVGQVTFEAGARGEEVVAAAAAHGLAVPAGFSPTVGMTGYALGGGIGWFARRTGLAAHRIVAADVVTGDGRLRRVDADHDPGLLWALRGGGGAFGVVVRTTMALEPQRHLHGGALFFAVERTRAILDAWQRWCGEQPDTVTSVARVLTLPPVDAVPAPLRGGTFCVIEAVHAGAADVLAPLRLLRPVVDTSGPLGLTDLPALHGDPREPVPVVGDHLLLDTLDEALLDVVADVAGPGSGSPLVNVELRHLGGALRRATADDGPIGAVDAAVAVHAMGMAGEPAAEAATEDHLARLRGALAPWDAGRVLANLCERATPAERVFAPAPLERLRATARRVDPAGLFVSSRPLEGA